MLFDIISSCFFSVGEYGDVSSLNGGGEPFDHGSGAPHRVRPPLYLKLHLYLRKHQRQIHAGDQIKHIQLDSFGFVQFGIILRKCPI